MYQIIPSGSWILCVGQDRYGMIVKKMIHLNESVSQCAPLNRSQGGDSDRGFEAQFACQHGFKARDYGSSSKLWIPGSLSVDI